MDGIILGPARGGPMTDLRRCQRVRVSCVRLPARPKSFGAAREDGRSHGVVGAAWKLKGSAGSHVGGNKSRIGLLTVVA